MSERMKVTQSASWPARRRRVVLIGGVVIAIGVVAVVGGLARHVLLEPAELPEPYRGAHRDVFPQLDFDAAKPGSPVETVYRALGKVPSDPCKVFTLVVEVTAEGRAGAAYVKEHRSEALDACMTSGVRDWRFAPARDCGGVAVPCVWTEDYSVICDDVVVALA